MSTLLQTIEADLKAGESWLVDEAQTAGMFFWNALKGVFIALAPGEGQILIDTLSAAVKAAGAGASIEQIETAALNTLVAEEKALLQKTGSGIIQTLIAAIKASV